MQRSLWTSQRLSPDQPVQNMALLTHIDGPIDVARLARSFDRVVASSDVLRTRIVRTESGDEVELLAAPIPDSPAPPMSEVRAMTRLEMEQLAERRCRRPLDMTRRGFDSLIAVHPDGTCSWYLNLHHVITDATSSAFVFEATAQAYFATDNGPGQVSPDGDYEWRYYQWASGLDRRLRSDGGGGPPTDGDGTEATTDRATKALRRARDHWDRRAGAPRLGALYRDARDDESAGDAPGGDTPNQRPATASRLALDVDDDMLSQINTRFEDQYRMLSPDLSWTVLLTTVTALYLHRVSGAEQFAIGLPVHHRNTQATRRLIGPTMEVFPVDITIEPHDSHHSLHQRVARAVLDTLRHAAPGTSPKPDYEAVVNIIPRAEQDQFGPYAASTSWVHPGAIDASHLMRVQLTRYHEGYGYEFALDLNHRGADITHRQRAAAHFLTVLDRVVNHPDQPIGDYAIITDDEAEIHHRWGHRMAGGVVPHSILPVLLDRLDSNHDIVLEETTSVEGAGEEEGIDSGRSWTGPELRSWILATARWIEGQGVEPGDRVAVELPRSPEALVAIMATLAVGASFVPLDPAQPSARRRRLVKRAGCRLVLNSVEEIGVQAKDPIDHDGSELAPAASPHGDDEAYLLFTSGSTGEPKGVPITHQGLADYITFAAQAYVAPGERLVAALFSALTFDLTITSLFVPLVTGGRTVVIGPDGPTGLAAIADHRDITWLKATPSHLELLVRLLPNDHALRTLVVGGEAFGRSLAESLLAFNPTARIFNEYGPTEAVVGCMIYQVPDGNGVGLPYGPDVPIGRPAPGVSLVVLDRYRQPVPVGSPGELCISHRGVTAGYLDAAATEEGGAEGGSPFMTIDGARFYRSGDLARLIATDDPGQGSDSGVVEHELVYLGRIDEQVKVGGIRLEPIEVEQVLNHHPSVGRSAVRVWSPSIEGADRPKHHCPRCGLPDNVPGVAVGDDGVCDTCHSFDRVAPVAQQWFKTPDDLARELVGAAESKTGDYDVLHLLSGGKDSTYALYRLVELGVKPYALTLDNGFISEEAKANVRASVADLGVDHEFVTTAAMNAIFADSLATYSNVCNGCYKAIYTLATNKAADLGIPVIVTGLSRGQLFETRLIPQQFSLDRFDPDAIDRAVIEARKIYHRTDDAVNRLLDTEIFSDDGVFDRIRYVDFYRYIDVELSEMLEFLETRAPWVRPSDTGRSTNCLINAAGIHTHLTEQGYHNYAVPYAWDVRLGHKTRDEAIAELSDHLDDPEKQAEIAGMLNTVGYEPHRREVLTAWLEPEPGFDIPDPSELREFLADRLPDFAIPAAFVAVDQLPLNTNGKLDASALPAPRRVHRAASGVYVAASTETETLVVSVWERILGIEPISIDDDFFALGGDSLAALEMIVAISERLGLNIPEDVAFRHTTPRALAVRIDGERGTEQRTDGEPSPPGPTPDGEVPALSTGQRAVLFDQASRPGDVMYNVGRVYRFDGDGPEPERLRIALERVAERHQPLSWTYGAERRKLTGAEAVAFTVGSPIDPEGLDRVLADVHRAPFDLENGPMLRALVQPVSDGSTAVLLVIHHVSGDADSFDVIWRDVNTLLEAADPVRARLTPLKTDYARFCQWQEDTRSDADRRYWLSVAPDEAAGTLAFAPGKGEADGFLIRTAAIAPDALASAASTVVGATPFALAFTAIAPALADHGTSPTVELGLITSTRSHPVAADLVGYFLNTVPVIIDPADQAGSDSATNLRAHIAAITGRLGSALAHRTYPLAHILADRRSAGLPAQPPGVFVAYDDLTDAEVAGATARQRVLSNGSAVVDATIFVERRHDRVDLSLEYRGSTMTAGQAERLLAAIDRSLTELVDCLLGHESTTVADTDLSVLVGPDLVQLDGPALTVDVIEQRLVEGGDAPAVVCADETLNWNELALRSNAVVRHLGNQGVQPGDRVVVSLGRSVDMVAAMIGVLRAGAVYVPVDPTYPRARIRLLTKRARAATVLSGYIDELYRVEPTDDAAPSTDPSDTGVERSPDDVAYVIFTSGSTGEPKPVAITHGQLSHSTKARPRFYGDPASDDDGVQFRFLMVSSPSFDSSIAGLFWTLAEGGTLVLPDDHSVHDVEALARLLIDGRITHTLMVPTLYQGVLDSLPRLGYGRPVGDGHWWPGQVIVAGEACPSALVDDHYHRFPLSRLTNEYGPTEATVWATAHHTRLGDDPVPIGRPIAGTWLAVVGPDGRPRPRGVIGELVLGGPTVAADHGAPSSELGSWTAEALPASSAEGSVFLTGDRAAVVDGTVEFHGRHDHQLSVNGTRIEPEEVEHALSGVDGVRAVIVTSLGRGRRPLDLLVAHVEVEPDAGDGDQEVLSALQDAAKAYLPPLLRPGHYEIHRADEPLPRTPNGKLDRAAAAKLAVTEFRLPPGPDLGSTPAGDMGNPWAELESKLAVLFAATLGRDRLAVTESFFDFGGHSLLAVDLMLAIEEETGRRVPVSELYRAPTPQLLAAEIARSGGDGDAATAQAGDRPERDARGHTFLVPIQPDGSRPPIFGIHVLGVNSAYFRPLSSHLGTDQPVLGLGQPNLDRDLQLDGPTSVADVAAGYVAEINRIRPDGPVVIAAISLGGVVAYETAQQLVAIGRDVPLMALFDAVGPDVADHTLTRRQQLGIHARALKAEPREYVSGRLAYQGQKVKRVAELAEARLRQRYGRESTHRLEVRRFIEANIQSQFNYEYQPYSNPMVVYKAADDPFTAHFLELDMGWRSVAHGGLTIKVVSGDHISMVAEPNVGLLARYLREDIDAHLPEPR